MTKTSGLSDLINSIGVSSSNKTTASTKANEASLVNRVTSSIMGLLGLKKEDGWTENADGDLTKEVREMRERLKKRNEWGEREVIMTKADWIKLHSGELLEGFAIGRAWKIK